MLTGNLALNLSTVHALVRWRRAEPHPVLATAPAWCDEDTTRALDRHALGELEQNRRLRRGRPDGELADTIGALLRPDREYYGWLTTTVDGRPFRFGVLAAAAYQEAVLVVRDHETDVVVLSTIRPSALAGEFLAQLPSVAPAAGRPVSTPYRDFLAATEPERDGFTGFGTSRNREVRAVEAVLSRPRTGGGSLYAAARAGSHGPRRRCAHPVNYLDTATGRWLTRLDTTPEGTIATLHPATLDMIATRLTTAERQLA